MLQLPDQLWWDHNAHYHRWLLKQVPERTALLPALERAAVLLRPGGVLAVVGLCKPSTVSDVAMELVSIPANAVVGMGLMLRGRAGKPDDDGMPWRPPSTSLREIRKVVERQLPGARLRRGVFWRYLLTWRRD